MTFIFIFTCKSFKVNGLWKRRKEGERKVGGRERNRKEGKKRNGIVMEPKYISTK